MKFERISMVEGMVPAGPTITPLEFPVRLVPTADAIGNLVNTTWSGRWNGKPGGKSWTN
jgi:hypothetical protein